MNYEFVQRMMRKNGIFILLSTLILIIILLYCLNGEFYSLNTIYYLEYTESFGMRIKSNIFIEAVLFLDTLVTYSILSSIIDDIDVYQYIRNRDIGRYFFRYGIGIYLTSIIFLLLLNSLFYICIRRVDVKNITVLLFVFFLILSLLNTAIGMMISLRIPVNIILVLGFLLSTVVNLDCFSHVLSYNMDDIEVKKMIIFMIVSILGLFFANRYILARREFY